MTNRVDHLRERLALGAFRDDTDEILRFRQEKRAGLGHVLGGVELKARD